jgi:nucleotide-binding universal stress UspA family protein
MIAVDGSDLDRRLADEARRLFGSDAEFWAVNVHNPRDTTLPGGPVVAPMYGGAAIGYGMAYPYVAPYPYDVATAPAGGVDRRGPQEERERVAGTAATQAGLDDAEIVPEGGDPSEAILRAAEQHRADVVVIGSHERSWWQRLIDPSVSSDVVEDARIPVLVVRDPS